MVSAVSGLHVPSRRAVLKTTIPTVFAGLLSGRQVKAIAEKKVEPKFRRVPRTQFISALGDPKSSSGTGAETWGLWREDPGPRGVRLRGGYDKLAANGGTSPAGWQFDNDDWWLEEHG